MSAFSRLPGVTLFTIGFREKPAQEFFELLQHAGVRKVVDVRLNADSHLMG